MASENERRARELLKLLADVETPVTELKMSTKTWAQRRAEEHGLRPGGHVIRLSATLADGRRYTALYRYETGASFGADGLRRLPDFKQENAEWDGVEDVSFDCGD